MDTASDVNHL